MVTKMLQLSENLYPVDEVIGTFIQCIISRSDIKEILFWLWELLYTIPNADDGLVCIYKLFYSTNNLNVGRYISRKVNEYRRSKDKRLLADVVINLRNLEPNFFAYKVNYYGTISKFPTTIYKLKSWMFQYPRNLRNLLGAVAAKDYKNIGYYLAQSLQRNGYDSTKAVLCDLGTVNKIDVDDGIDLDDGVNSNLDIHGLLELSSLVSRLVASGDMSPRAHFLRSDKNLIKNMDYHFTKKSEKYYLKLSERRLYSTHAYLLPGDYTRFEVESLRDACWYNWEYYAYESLAWNQRFSDYKGKQNHDKIEISWIDDDHLEAFYNDDNAMDFDEQTFEVQQMSLHDVHVCTSAEEWIEKLQKICLTKNLGKLKI